MTTSFDSEFLKIDRLNVRFELFNLAPQDLLNDVRLTLNRGRVHFLFGGNGSGKTSLLKTLIGLLPENIRANEKVVSFPTGKIISGSDLPRLIKLGYIPQHPHEALIPSFNVSENISFRSFLRGNSGFSDWLIKQRFSPNVQESVEEIINKFEVTRGLLSDKLHSNVMNLSGGEQQILNLASLVYDECELLIMDEPTSKLDKKNKDSFWKLVSEIKQTGNHTMLIVTHDGMSDAVSRLADSIYRIVDKKIVKEVY